MERNKNSADGTAVVGGGSFRITIGRQNTIKTFVEQPDFSKYSGFLLDMDGVLQKNGVPIEGAAYFLKKLRDFQCPYILLTNECRYTNDQLSQKLVGMLGKAAAEPADIYSSANSTRDFFERLISKGYTDSTYVIGEDGLVSNVRKAYSKFINSVGRVVTALEPHNETESEIGFVVVGSVFQSNTRVIERAAGFISRGARLVHTCPDLYDLNSDGSFCFGMPKSTVYILEKACSVNSYNLGKPNPHMIRMAQTRLIKKRDLKWRDVLFVGDSINTDVRTAIENGIDSCLLMSGCTSNNDLQRSPLLPNYVFPNIGNLAEMVFCGENNWMEIQKKYNYKKSP